MKTLTAAMIAGVSLLATAAALPEMAFAAPAAVPASALADPGRPADDVARDAARKPVELAAFAGIKAGDRVVDLIPGGGYFTFVFSGLVGPTGHVYATVPAPAKAYMAKKTAVIEAWAATHPNTSVVYSAAGFTSPDGPADVVWTAQNYHDLYNPMGPSSGAADLLPINKGIFAALKPGGVYLIVDHSAPAGSGTADTKTLHRIDEAVVRKDVEAAGFVFEGSSDLLRNPADPRTALVFDPSIRGKTDQFVLKFRKPK
jgi:predicted methyltransferase